MARLGEFDLADRLAPLIPRWVTQLSVAALCLIAGRIVRLVIDAFAPDSAPFALVFPVVMVATLFGRWLAGAVTAVVSVTYAWFHLYPVRESFSFVDPKGAANVAVIGIAAGLTVIIGDIFSRAVRRATQERDRQIADRDLFLAEFDHRVKNNFTIVTGLLDMQRRRASDPATAEALGAALARVESIGRAHRHLYRSGQPGLVEMRDYLGDLCATLSDALLLRGGVVLECNVAEGALPRDRAVSIGLVINELVTNAAKHAFNGRETGTITVTFGPRPGGWVLTVSDNGSGIDEKAKPSADGGLGSRLIDAFARQAGGTISVDSDRTGTIVTLLLGA
ncbi:MAG TPA: histidine kinase dimerization/phosphoacceptor domain -containing protein [Sphingomonas sp.]|nr:histidine kinase dimerization/phosphoacceptor domain -containing protein [Sphingomonas sp.]